MRFAIGFGFSALCLILPLSGECQPGKGKKNEKTGEVNTPPAKGERKETTLRVGDAAPNFTLSDIKQRRDVTLGDFKGKKPVVLIFGSYT